MSENQRDLGVDQVRRKLLRSTAVLGGAFAAGQLPYDSPAVKSFFGTRSAWAQPSMVVSPIVQVTQPTSAPIVIVTGGGVVSPASTGPSAAAVEEPSATETFQVKNVGSVAVIFGPPTITGGGAAAFMIEGATLEGMPTMAPFTMEPGEVVEITFRYTCGTTEDGVVSEATIELDITPAEGPGPVTGVEDVVVSGVCGTLSCALECAEERSEGCNGSVEGFTIFLDIGNTEEGLNVRNDGSLPIRVVEVKLVPPMPAPDPPIVEVDAMAGVIAPGAALLQTLRSVCPIMPTSQTARQPGGFIDHGIEVTVESADLFDGMAIPVECEPSSPIVRVQCDEDEGDF